MRALEYPFDNDYILRKKRTIKRELLNNGENFRIKKRLAILGGSTTQNVKDCMELFLLNYGIEPEFYESDYAQYWNEVMFDQGELSSFQPDIVYIHTTARNIMAYPSIKDTELDIEKKLDENLVHFRKMWERLEEKYHCQVIQNNFELPYYRLLGNRDCYDVHGRVNFINRLNEEFNLYAQQHDNFHLNDINYLASCYGLSEWADPFSWHMYKYALAVPAIPELAYSVANIIKSILGKNRKTLVLDLDNTLWGGVVGDDGVDNIEIGQESAVGQVYSEFQQYIKEQKSLGILLCINSKNDIENAIAGLKKKDNTLKLDDFIIIKANWNSKDLNLAEIANELNIGLDSIVFIDDNPAERQIVSSQLPEVVVPKLEAPVSYIRIIDRAGYFEVTNYSLDDLNRSEMYIVDQERRKIQENFSDYEEYLLSLEMRAEINHVSHSNIKRVVQLINKTNQFNLTTKRLTSSEVAGMMDSEKFILLYGRLEDRFGDNGIVSVLIARREDRQAIIELFLMSCRVLKRDLEKAMLDRLVLECKEFGITQLLGLYYPTAKNKLVKNLYAELGFERISEDSYGNSVWKFGVAEQYILKNTVIKVKE